MREQIELPPLPTPARTDYPWQGHSRQCDWFTAEQMREYACTALGGREPKTPAEPLDDWWAKAIELLGEVEVAAYQAGRSQRDMGLDRRTTAAFGAMTTHLRKVALAGEPVAWRNPHYPSEVYSDDQMDPMWRFMMTPLYTRADKEPK